MKSNKFSQLRNWKFLAFCLKSDFAEAFSKIVASSFLKN